METTDECCEHGDELQGFVKCGDLLTSWGTVSFRVRIMHHGP